MLLRVFARRRDVPSPEGATRDGRASLSAIPGEVVLLSKVFDGLTVIELADRRNQMVGKIMSDAGARVIQIEPTRGSPGRYVGPFVNDVEDPNKSLDYWWFNTGKESVCIDITRLPGQQMLRRLIASADVFVESTKPGTLAALGLDYASVAPSNSKLIYASLTDFGQTGPWAQLEMNDPAHLALGGQMGVGGYSDPKETPIGGQGRQAYNAASVMMAHSITVALWDRMTTDLGQYVDVAIHDCCAICTERPVSYWLWYNQPSVRQTGQHAGPTYAPPIQVQAADGRHMNARFNFPPNVWPKMLGWMKELGVAGDLEDEKYNDAPTRQAAAAVGGPVDVAMKALLAKVPAQEAFEKAQSFGLTWGVIRAPEENLGISHFAERGFWRDVEHEEIGKTVPYPRGFYKSDGLDVSPDGRAPHLGEHTRAVLTKELGIDATQVELLAQTGVVR